MLQEFARQEIIYGFMLDGGGAFAPTSSRNESAVEIHLSPKLLDLGLRQE
jgi:hypothetical protein